MKTIRVLLYALLTFLVVVAFVVRRRAAESGEDYGTALQGLLSDATRGRSAAWEHLQHAVQDGQKAAAARGQEFDEDWPAPALAPRETASMTEEMVLLEVPAAASSLPVVRMVVGGMAARADLTLSELDELHMALEELLRAAHDPQSTPRYRLQIEAAERSVRIVAGPFASPQLLTRLKDPSCALVQRMVTFDVRGQSAGAYSVVVTKARRA